MWTIALLVYLGFSAIVFVLLMSMLILGKRSDEDGELHKHEKPQSTSTMPPASTRFKKVMPRRSWRAAALRMVGTQRTEKKS